MCPEMGIAKEKDASRLFYFSVIRISFIVTDSHVQVITSFHVHGT